MNQTDFINAIRKVSARGAKAMQAYLDNNDKRLDQSYLEKYQTAHEVLESIMAWSHSDEKRNFWASIFTQLSDIENNIQPAATTLFFSAPKDEVKVLQKFLKTEGYKTKATGKTIVSLTIWPKK